ncbi:MAG: divalent metal cation transporter [Methanosarcina barkeri]|nr:divalent metal cation transporter [Methanosarcina sp. ERenArc_MAG2]
MALRPLKALKGLLGNVGPGFITGAADDDPSGIATYAQTGAIFGYGRLWLVWFTGPFIIVIQHMCGRIGMVTGKGLAGVILEHYSRRLLYVTVSLLVIANTINIGADLGAMASSAQMLLGLPFLFWLIFITGSVIALEIFVPYKTYSRILKYLALTLFSYVLTALVIRLDWKVVFHATLVPHFEFSANYLFNIVAILGTTISPYLFFWQASQEVEEEIVNGQIPEMGIGKPRVTRRRVTEMDGDTVIGMFFSQVIMFFIIGTTAATLHTGGITTIQTASQAAEAPAAAGR